MLAGSASGYVTAYGQLAMNAAGQAAIVPNASNELAVHCHQTTGGQGIDVGIGWLTVLVPPPPIFIPNWLENGAGLTAAIFQRHEFGRQRVCAHGYQCGFQLGRQFARRRPARQSFLRPLDG